MKQRKLCASDINFRSNNECNGHVNSFKTANKHEFPSTNGNRCRNFKINIDNSTPKVCAHEAQMKTKKRSQQRCRQPSQTYRIQTSFRNATTFTEFAFHRIVLFIIVILLFVGSCVANGQQRDLHANTQNRDIFNVHKTHYVIEPAIFDGQNQRKLLTTTRQTDGSHAPHIILEYTHLDSTIVADLFLNPRLLTDTHFLRTQNADGSKRIQTFDRTNANLCHYQGQIRNNANSKVVLSTCHGIKGMIFDGKQTYTIHPNEKDSVKGPHYLFSQNQMNESHPLVMNAVYDELNDIVATPKRKVKRSVNESTAREPYNANKQSSYVELVIVVDNDVYKDMNENLDKIHQYCKDIANIINSLYVPLNIFIALVGVVVWTERNEIELTNDGDKTLKNFLNYRRKALIKDHPNDNAQLLTKMQFDGGVVGKALKGPICTYEFSGGVSTYHSPIVSVVATTIAHEMGHNFGMEHDTSDCKCDDERCIMSASSSSIAPTQWSECSIHQLNLAIHQGMNHCLRNIPKFLFEPPTCGNGFLEPGEECDCGLPSVCTNTCCDAKTCRLHSNSTCATGKCCDLTTCRLHEAGFECRPSTGECDLPEYCNGNTEFCPLDYFKRDTEVCEGGKAYCYNGLCKSRDDQCKLLWGPSGKSSEQCYEKNLDGTRHGNCGYNRSSGVYKNCSREDIFCGMLQCRHLNERLEFGLESVAVLSHSFITYGRNIIPCRTAVIDLGLDSIDPGLAPDGSKCDDGKMCVSQKCIPIEKLRIDGHVKDCATDCNKHGVCNNMGQCHCEKGFAPPNCDSPGPGGSLISGPAQNPYDGYGFVRVLYVFFLGVVPFISLSLLVFYYWRHKLPWLISPSANDMKISVRHYPERPPPPPPSAPMTHQLSPSSTDDMNATLLKSSNGADDQIKRELFGNFKGFSLKPLPMTKPNIVGASNVAYVHPVAKAESSNEHCIPTRAAPLPPTTHSPKKLQVKSSPKSSPSSFRYQNIAEPAKESPETPIEVKLFATKSDAKERPKISHPVLENSTVSVKEFIATANAAQNMPTAKPVLPKSVVENQSRNIAQKPNNLSLPRVDKTSIDKNSLKKLEISAPIKAASFSRSQSMRSPSTEKSVAKRNVLASGSMRYPAGSKRPMVVDRPKNPPPPRPANGPSGSSSLRNIYANEGTSVQNSSDNIYCVIEDVQESPPQNGLLTEIVNEIENRNLNSIYSTSKNQRKKPTVNTGEQMTYENLSKPAESVTQSDNNYMNTAAITKQVPNQNSDSIKSATIEMPKSNVASIAKKLSSNLAMGNSKPTIAAKPTIPNLMDAKIVGTSNKETSQFDSAKKPYTKPTYSNGSSKATIKPTSSVRMMHKRFENHNA